MSLLRVVPVLVLLLASYPGASWGAPLEILPFQTANRNPVTQLFGLPGPGTAILLPHGNTSAELSLDTIQNFSKNSRSGEVTFFDGETYRLNFGLRHGVAPGLEIGFDIPYLSHRGGFLDGFIEGFHDTFALSQSGRDRFPRNQLLYSYIRAGEEEIRIDGSTEGLGDLRLRTAWQLWPSADGPPRGAALHASLKLPTGDSDELLGSGSTDLAIWLSGTRGWETGGAALAIFGAAGIMVMTDGEVVEKQQRNLTGFGTLGCGWRPADWIVLKIQFDGHTPLYDSDLPELGRFAGQLTMGGDLALGEQTALEIGVSEDVVVDTAPDVIFRLALRSRF